MTTVDVMEALQEIRSLARQVAQEQLRPHVERWDHTRELDGEVLAQLAELGFFGMPVPETSGGMGFDLPTYAAALEQLAWGDAAVALVIARSTHAADLLQRGGSEAQKAQWLERLVSGEVIGCTAFPEGSGGDTVLAERSADGWTLRGACRFVVNGGAAGLVVVPVRTTGATSLFLVPANAPGVRQGERHATTGMRALRIVDLQLDGVELSDDSVLEAAASAAGTPGSNLDRLALAAISLGIAQAALDHALAYADTREQFGTKLRQFEGMQVKLADMAVRVSAARGLVEAAAAAPDTRTTSIAKLYASEAAMAVSTDAVQVFGGYGYMRDYPVEKLMRDAKGCEILGGANQRLRVLIANELYAGRD